MRLVNWRSLVVGTAGFGLAACGDDVIVQNDPPVLSASPASISCNTGQTVPVAITLQNGTATSTFTFAGVSSGSGAAPFTVAQVGTSSAATITCGNTAGTGFVTVSSPGAATIQVPVVVTQQAGGGSGGVLGFSINPPAAAIGVGGTQTLRVDFVLQSGTPAPTNVRWASLNPTVARVDSVTGVVTGVSAGTAQVQARIPGSTLQPATAQITVLQSLLIGGINLGTNQAGITLRGGQTVQLAPIVTLAPGAPATTSQGVTFRLPAGDSLVARVSSTGLVTGGTQAGNTTLTIVSQADTNFRVTIPVVVGASTQARVSIQDIRDSAGRTVDPTNVARTVNLVINFEAGDVLADSIVARIGTFQQTCQRFSAGAAALYRAASRSSAAQVAEIICQINTAAFDTTTGVARVQNGNQTVSVVLFGRLGGGQTSQQATITRQLTLNNVSGFFAQVTNTPTTEQAANGGTGRASDPVGRVWLGGSFRVRILPVFFGETGTGAAPATVTVSMVDSLGGAERVIATRTTSDTSAAAVFGGRTAAAPVIGADSIIGYTSPTTLLVASQNGTFLRLASTTGSVQFLTANGGVSVTAPRLFIDNQEPPAPAQPSFAAAFRVDPADPNSAAFINGTVAFNTTNLAISNLSTVGTGVQADNGGVDRVQIRFQQAAAAGLTGTTAFTTIATGQDVAPSNTATTYALRVQAVDALGNASESNTAARFGVDIAGPTFDAVATPANLNQQNTGASATVGFTNLVDNASGINPGSALQASIRLLAPSDTSTAALSVTSAANAYCATTSTTNPVPFGAGSTTLDRTCATVTLPNPATVTQNGYYTVTQAARDRAGNISGTTTRQFVIDRIAPTAALTAGFAAINGPIARGSTLSVAPFTFTDNLDLIRSFAIEDFGLAGCDATGSAAGTCLAFEGPALGTLFDNVLTRTATPLFNVPVVGRVSTVAAGTLTAADLGFLLGTATDAGNNVAAPASTPFQAGVVTGTAAAFALTQSFDLTAALGTGVTQISTGGGTTGNTTGRTATVTATLVGPTATFNNPVVRAELRYFDVTLNAFRSAGDLVLTGQTDDGTNRRYTFSGAFTPTNASFLSPQNGGTTTLIVVGYAANGDALLSGTAPITLVP